MDSNIQQEPSPSYGFRSYAELIKQRLIYGRFYCGWSIRQGRYDFQVMYSDVDDGRYGQIPIGYEMKAWAATPPSDWVLRVYMDGTALYRPYMLGWLRYPTLRTIQRVLEYFFYKEAEIEDSTSRYHKTHILRRKPINPHCLTPVAKGFGEFLTNKYNKRKGA